MRRGVWNGLLGVSVCSFLSVNMVSAGWVTMLQEQDLSKSREIQEERAGRQKDRDDEGGVQPGQEQDHLFLVAGIKGEETVTLNTGFVLEIEDEYIVVTDQEVWTDEADRYVLVDYEPWDLYELKEPVVIDNILSFVFESVMPQASYIMEPGDPEDQQEAKILYTVKSETGEMRTMSAAVTSMERVEAEEGDRMTLKTEDTDENDPLDVLTEEDVVWPAGVVDQEGKLMGLMTSDEKIVLFHPD